MESLDLALNGKSLDDIMYQRMKNRERQRRYRERKRLQAESFNRASTKSPPPTIPPAEPSPKRKTNQHITRVHCTRDWKKDARRAHAIKQEVPSVVLPSHAVAPTEENQGSYSTAATEQYANGGGPSANTPGADTREKDRNRPGRRDWKAEARNKKL